MFCLLRMSDEKNVDCMVYVLVSRDNIERMKAIGKMGNTFDDVVTMLLDYYEDLRRQEWVNSKSIENQYNEQLINERRQSYANLHRSSMICESFADSELPTSGEQEKTSQPSPNFKSKGRKVIYR